MAKDSIKIFLDTEFIERPCKIDLISIGMVADDGREFYNISIDHDRREAHPWVQENVIDKLEADQKLWFYHHEIKQNVLDFVGEDIPEFWGDYADYDWVVFCWLFGSMVDLPKGWPMYCRDMKQWRDQMGVDDEHLPKQTDGHHNALADAKWNKEVWEFLKEREG